MNLYKKEIYKKSLQHAERRNHKYLYKIGDRYIYPDDLQKANATQRHHAEVLADRRQIKKDRAHVKENKEITNVMRKELRNYGMNLSKKDANQLRRNINTNSQIQSAHQRTVSTVPGTYDQERRATDPEAAKAQIAERRKRKETENRPLRTADQQASAHQTSIKKTDNSDGTKRMERRVADADAAKAQIKERREKKSKLVEGQRKSAHQGSNGAFRLTEELERQKIKTKARKTIARTEAGVEAGRNRKKPKMSKEYQEELAYNSKKNVYPEKVLKENVITENTITEKDTLPEKKKKKKPTVKGSKKILTWDNAKIKRWR